MTVVGLLFCCLLIEPLPSADPAAVSSYRPRSPDPDRGLYAIWYGRNLSLLDLPYVTGGQVVVQWQQVNPGPGRFDFAPLAEGLAGLAAIGRRATIQVNGNHKPTWLFDRVPSHPDRLSHQVKDLPGTLMYWHPAHRDAYLALLDALAEFLADSPLRPTVLGVRLNFNALGTEHWHVSGEAREPATWRHPAGVPPGEPWTPTVAAAYRQAVVTRYVERLQPLVRVFVRNNLAPEEVAAWAPLFRDGRLAWFHTSTEAEPRTPGVERQYATFLDYCRSGQTVAYAESWADAWGRHGGQTDPRFCGPAQWNYWRLLADLHCGVSFIAVYGDDLRAALPDRPDAAADAPPAAFEAAFRFAARYAGYHASPEQSPGAWVAFRRAATAQNTGAKLTRLTGDYTFLAGRLSGQPEHPVEVAVPPRAEPFGAWALRLPAGGAVELVIDQRFAASLAGSRPRLRVVAQSLTDSELSLTVTASGVTRTFRVAPGGWREPTEPLPGFDPAWRSPAGGSLRLSSEAECLLHMIELKRESDDA